MLRYFGVLAGHAKDRNDVVPATAKEDPSGQLCLFTSPETDTEAPKKKLSRTPWAKLLARIFKVDAETCPRCGSPCRIVAFVTDKDERALVPTSWARSARVTAQNLFAACPSTLVAMLSGDFAGGTPRPVASGPQAIEGNGAVVCPECGARYAKGAKFCQLDGARLVEQDPYLGRVLLDQFRIEEEIGSGGMGTVYRASQLTVDRQVAIKLLHPGLIRNQDAVRRFKREAKVATSLDHPNVVRVFLCGELPDGSVYLVMEHLAGESLGGLLARKPRLSLTRALRILIQVCDGIGDAHLHGVVHRDIKPENIFLIERAGERDFVKVLDFGIARFLTQEQTALTQSGLIFGTARYISPEGAAGEVTDARSDVYSLGVLAYELLTGAPPFDSKSPVSLLMQQIHDDPVRPTHQARGDVLPKRFADIVMRCLAKHPDLRPDDARELAIALEEAATAEGLETALPGRRFSTLGRRPIRTHEAPSSQQRMPPMGALAAAGPSLFPATGSMHPYSRQARAAATPVSTPQHTLQGAPSPFVSEEMKVPGLVSRKKVLWLVVAMVLAAVGTVGTVWLLEVTAEAREQARLSSLEDEVRVALVRGHYDAPAKENVLELTAELLAAVPDHGPALNYRREAAHRLELEALTAKAQGFDDEARALFERVLALNPENGAAKRALARQAQQAQQVVPIPVGQAEEDPQEPPPVAPRRRRPSAGRSAAPTPRSPRQAPPVADGPQPEAETKGRFRIPVARDPNAPAAPAAPARPRQGAGTEEDPGDNTANRDEGIDWSLPGSQRNDRKPVTARPADPDELPTPPAPPPRPAPSAPPDPWSSEF